jgi:hypothetical protein
MTYSSRLIKATALITDTKALMSSWDLNLDTATNFQVAQENNIFGKASRSRVKDMLDIFNQRYFYDPTVGKALVKLVQSTVPASWINPLLFYYSAKNDVTLRDIVLEVVNPRRKAGFYDINVDHVIRQLRDWSAKGVTTSPWGEKTIIRVAQHALAALRDFGVLEGSIQKRFIPLTLPIEAFTFITFDLMKNTGSGDKVLHSLEWGLFNLQPNDVEKFFIEAHQQRLCEYFAAGEVIRLEFPFATYTELADALIKRSRS